MKCSIQIGVRSFFGLFSLNSSSVRFSCFRTAGTTPDQQKKPKKKKRQKVAGRLEPDVIQSCCWYCAFGFCAGERPNCTAAAATSWFLALSIQQPGPIKANNNRPLRTLENMQYRLKNFQGLWSFISFLGDEFGDLECRMEHLLWCPEAQQQTGTTQQPATTTLQQLFAIHIKTPINCSQSSSEYNIPKGRYNYKKSDVIYTGSL